MGRTTNGRVSPTSPRYGSAVDKMARRAKRRKKLSEKRVDEVSPRQESELRAARFAVQAAQLAQLEAAHG